MLSDISILYAALGVYNEIVRAENKEIETMKNREREIAIKSTQNKLRRM